MHGKIRFISFESLSKRELEVLQLAVLGETDRSIGYSLGVAAGTLGTYWNRIRRKTGCLSRAELTAQYIKCVTERRLASALVAVLQRCRKPDVPGKVAAEILGEVPIVLLVLDHELHVRKCNIQAKEFFGTDLNSYSSAKELVVPEQSADFCNFLLRTRTSNQFERCRALPSGPNTAMQIDWTAKHLEDSREFLLMATPATDCNKAGQIRLTKAVVRLHKAESEGGVVLK
ncbi:MAG: helix-turn-helix transcriptional regulator [Chthonomonadaceae bacterium]|nr:helix-turn-helix transcriptional regulator [Chthonomonadaceae bacterium]